MSEKLHFHLVTGPELSESERSLFAEFGRDVYLPSFPNDDERESLEEDIIPRLLDHSGYVRTYVVFLVDEAGNGGGRVLAGEICDWYPESKDLEIIYLAVNPRERRGGFGSKVLQEGTARIVDAIEKETGEKVRRLYFETENPDKPQLDEHLVMKLQDRIRFFGKNGGSVALEEYYQPPLSTDKDWADNMMLCTLPVFRLDEQSCVEDYELETSIPEDELFGFLTCFYIGLDHAELTPKGEACLKEMRKAVNEEGEVALKRIEAYHFRFPYAAVSSHFLIDPAPGTLDFRHEDPVFNSYECDLMRYGLQDYEERPIVTHHYKLLKNVSLRLPTRYQYSSEGSRFVVRQWDLTDLAADVSFNWSYHRKFDRFMATMTFAPSEGASFSELDVLKIIALSGFGSKQEDFQALEPVRISFPDDDGTLREVSSFEEFVQAVFGLKNPPRKTGTGITEIDLLEMQGERDFKSFKQMKDGLLCEGPKESVWNKTLCGIILGIFDFMRMNEGEIADTMKPFQVRDTFFMQLFRGNLLQIRFNASDERIDKILTSAYLIIPSAVLAFNEEVLRVNAEQLAELEKNDGRAMAKDGRRRRLLSDFDRFSYLSGEVKKLETSISDNYIQDIFQYETEQQVLQFGTLQRGLSKTLSKLKEGIAFQMDHSTEFKDKYTGSIDTLQNIILLMLAILQVATIKSMDEITSFAWVLMALALLAGMYFFFRKRRL